MTLQKIALEEHFIHPDFQEYEAHVKAGKRAFFAEEIKERLPDFEKYRLEAMDEAGIDICVLSMTSPGLQAEHDARKAVRKAGLANEFLAGQIQKHPDRFAGFAHLPMQDPEAASFELTRCVREYNFKGAMINSHTNGIYLDDARYQEFWSAVVELNVPIYLHPADAYERPHSFQQYPILQGAFWGWTVETATHALRLILSGLFDRKPGLKIILGHMGETLPFLLWRLDSRFKTSVPTVALKKLPSQYIKENFVITTAGVCAREPLVCAIDALGVDNVLFSTDYPFENAVEAARFIESVDIGEEDRVKICSENARKLLGL